MVSGQDHPWLAARLQELGFDVTIMIDDVQPLFDAQKLPSASVSFDYNNYHNLDDVSYENINSINLEFIFLLFFMSQVRRHIDVNVSPDTSSVLQTPSSTKLFKMVLTLYQRRNFISRANAMPS